MDEPQGEERILTIEEAPGVARMLHRNERLAEAELVYQWILERAPEHAESLHYSGVLAYQQGRSDDAIRLVGRSLELEPDRADWHSNLGIILQGQNALDDAIAAYERAIALDPRHANAHSNLGVLFRAQRKHVEAEAAYRLAIDLNPDHVDAHHNLGVLLSATGRMFEAVKSFCRALTLRPNHPEARRLLALAYCIIDRPDAAVEVCEAWVAEQPDDPVARHSLAACSGRDVPPRASDAYVEQTFDGFSKSFEVKLAQLRYQAPALVADAVAGAGLAAGRALDVLDAGCGTGLCGPLMAPYARRLVGVDLSGGMLERAKEKQVYDELVKGELTTHLRAAHEAFDVIVSADTLVYFGALEEAVAAAAGALRPEGVFIFTLEETTDPAERRPYVLRPHGRYNHRRDYVERLLVDEGLHPDITRAELRLESGVPVAGLLVRATRPASASAGDRGARGDEREALPAIGENRA